MSGWLFLFTVLYSAGLLFGMIFVVIMFSDLESDYINPIDFCNKLNSFVIPEYAAHGFLALLFLLFGQWTALLWNLPLLAWNINKVMNNAHMYDATEIFRSLPGHQKEAYFKIGFYSVSFFYYLYRMIAAFVADSEF
ncbi:cornichon [Crassisporium funariophilum]|nr:cornichon [Crassisporium funariophilum]